MTLTEKVAAISTAMAAVRSAEEALIMSDPSDPTAGVLQPGQAVAILEAGKVYANVEGRLVEFALVVAQPDSHDLADLDKLRIKLDDVEQQQGGKDVSAGS